MVGMGECDCPFCRLEKHRIRLESELAVAFPDRFPVTQGHTLVLPKRHVASLFELPDEEQAAVWKLAAQVRALLLVEFKPDGFNVGLNDGTAAGPPEWVPPPADEWPRPPERTGRIDVTALIVGAVCGGGVAGAVALLGGALSVPVRGAILGALTGLVVAPLIVLAMFWSMITRPMSTRGMASEGALSRLATAVLHRKYGAVAAHVSILLLVAMGIGGFAGCHVHAVGPALVLLAVLGAAVLGAGAGAVLPAQRDVASPGVADTDGSPE
jgi:hypothetical protein